MPSFSLSRTLLKPRPIVDEIAKIDGTPATIFQRMNGRATCCVSAAASNLDIGTRAIGDYVPADSRDTDSAKALQEVLLGPRLHRQTVPRLNQLLNRLSTADEQSGSGGWYVADRTAGRPDPSQSQASPGSGNQCRPCRIVYLAGIRPKARDGISPCRYALEGSDLWNEQDAAGHPFINDICLKATSWHQVNSLITDTNALPASAVTSHSSRALCLCSRTRLGCRLYATGDRSLAGLRPRKRLLLGIWMLLGIGVAATGLAVASGSSSPKI